MSAALSFSELLQRDGAIPPRYERGKWKCGHCEGKSWTLSVDLDRELAFCHRCHWKASRRSLERELGLSVAEPTPAERRKARLIRREAEEFSEWARRKRIATAALLRDLDSYERQWREAGLEQLTAGQQVSEGVLAKLRILAMWQGKAETQWRRLCEFESTAPELYEEFVSRRAAA